MGLGGALAIAIKRCVCGEGGHKFSAMLYLVVRSSGGTGREVVEVKVEDKWGLNHIFYNRLHQPSSLETNITMIKTRGWICIELRLNAKPKGESSALLLFFFPLQDKNDEWWAEWLVKVWILYCLCCCRGLPGIHWHFHFHRKSNSRPNNEL